MMCQALINIVKVFIKSAQKRHETYLPGYVKIIWTASAASKDKVV